MERQGTQVKKLEANHAHLVSRNNFRVLIFQVGQRSEVRTSWCLNFLRKTANRSKWRSEVMAICLGGWQ